MCLPSPSYTKTSHLRKAVHCVRTGEQDRAAKPPALPQVRTHRWQSVQLGRAGVRQIAQGGVDGDRGRRLVGSEGTIGQLEDDQPVPGRAADPEWLASLLAVGRVIDITAVKRRAEGLVVEGAGEGLADRDLGRRPQRHDRNWGSALAGPQTFRQ